MGVPDVQSLRLEIAEMGTTVVKPWRHKRHRSLVYETHPTLGYYVSGGTTGLWSQLRSRADGREVMLRCRERAPSEERLRQWDEIDARLSDVERAAIAVVPEPPVVAARCRFRSEELSLREVRIEDDGTFVLFFDSPTGDTINLWPMVTFDGWSIIGSEWAS
jgi:hypothetical protein